MRASGGSEADGAGPTPRQEEVLDVALDLLAAGGDALTMSAVAQRASCSKETLYKWFGDRDGLLTATVRWQASKVRAGNYDVERLDAAALLASLEAFAVNWLKVISTRTSIALNRVAIGQAATGTSNLGTTTETVTHCITGKPQERLPTRSMGHVTPGFCLELFAAC